MTPIQIRFDDIVFWVYLDGRRLPASEVDELAKKDGFNGTQEMWDFWREQHDNATFNGIMIRWKPISQDALESADD